MKGWHLATWRDTHKVAGLNSQSPEFFPTAPKRAATFSFKVAAIGFHFLTCVQSKLLLQESYQSQHEGLFPDILSNPGEFRWSLDAAETGATKAA